MTWRAFFYRFLRLLGLTLLLVAMLAALGFVVAGLLYWRQATS